MRLGLGSGFNRSSGGIWAPSGAPSTPLTIISSTTINFLHLSDVNVVGGATCSSWGDMTANGRNWAQGGASSIQPAVTAGGPGGKQYLLFDGVDDYMTEPFSPPATTSGFLMFWFRRDSTNTLMYPINGSTTGTGRFSLRTDTAGSVNMSNSTNVNSTACAVGTWFRAWANYTGSVADELRIGTPAATTGASAGTLGSNGGLWMGCTGALAGFAAISVVGIMHCVAKPNAGELTALDDWTTSYWGGAVQV